MEEKTKNKNKNKNENKNKTKQNKTKTKTKKPWPQKLPSPGIGGAHYALAKPGETVQSAIVSNMQKTD